jgi:hypothetical protein
LVEFPGSACNYKYGEGCEEGLSACSEFDGDSEDVWTDVGFGGGD